MEGHKVFCFDMTFDATVNPVAYESDELFFIDTESEYDTWNMDPVTPEKAFEIYPEVKLISVNHFYETPGKANKIKVITEKRGTLLAAGVAESFRATHKGKQTETFDDYN